ncbi:hypothetical protein ACIPSE_30345 [Streptomyces sp. NPDC090106]|uniref:hypothetical protein n=1 Tax=Streptomyces sp. NPDC090106 TaxID=3365946 RepID=UPI0038233246
MRRDRTTRRISGLLSGLTLLFAVAACASVESGLASREGSSAAPEPSTAAASPSTGSPSPSASTSPSGTAHSTTRPRPTEPSSAPPKTSAAVEAGYPNAGNTGPRGFLKRDASGNVSIRTDGAVIKGKDIVGSLDIYADDVTIIDTKITSTNWWGVNLRPGFKGLRVLHSTITAIPGEGPDNGGVNYAVSNMGSSSIEVGWCDISVFGNALSMGQGYLHDNYVHGLIPFRNSGGEWQHTDAVISGGGNSGKLIVRHNTLLNSVPVDKGASAAIGLFADTGHVSNTVIDDNLLAGGAYALYGGGDGATGITVTDNVFSTRYHRYSGHYGAVTAWNAGGAGNVWSGNRFSDGTPITPRKAG